MNTNKEDPGFIGVHVLPLVFSRHRFLRSRLGVRLRSEPRPKGAVRQEYVTEFLK